ncbi:Gfo/Idh/MocA family protein [Microbacterium sp. HJ5]
MLTIGVLGAAKIAPEALLAPARELDDVQVGAVAARDPRRARAFAGTHGIPHAHDNYDSLLADPNIDGVYIGLPIGLHGRWTLAAVAAGKHVLCEKPLTANAEEAHAVHVAANAASRVVMEGHHTSHHPQTRRAAQIVRSGRLGRISFAAASYVAPIPEDDEVRWSEELAGGALMDLGCYPVRWLRDVLGVAPTVVSAVATSLGQVDSSMDARLDYVGVGARVRAGMRGDLGVDVRAEVRGTNGRMTVTMPFQPHLGGEIVADGGHWSLHETADPRSSFSFQLEAFRDAVVAGGPNHTSVSRSIETMRTIDSIYRAAGLRERKARGEGPPPRGSGIPGERT